MRSTSNAARRRAGVAVASVAALLGTMLIGAGSASASPPVHINEGGNGTYLALGDSVAFGFTPFETTPLSTYSNPNNFTSYANYVATDLGLTLTNASCPGETTASLIDNTAPSYGCEGTSGYRTLFLLHVSYSGSQLAYAVSYLKSHPHTRLVTIDIGANDAFLCEATAPNYCTTKSEKEAVFQSIASNLTIIYHALRVEAGYTHAIVALDYYSLSYTSQSQMELTEALNQAIIAPTLAAGGVVADGFGAFEAASASYGGDPCAAGLLIPLPGGTCNVHPTQLGHQILAKAIKAALTPPYGVGAANGQLRAMSH